MEQTPRIKNARTEKLWSLGLLAASLIWGVGFIFTKMALDAGLSAAAIMAGRFVLASLVVGLLFHKVIRRSYRPGQWKSGLVLGTFLFLGFYVQTLGLVYTTPAKNAFITGTYVVLVPLLWWVVSKKRPSVLVFVACGLSLAGVGILSLNPAEGFALGLGEGLTLLSAVFYACQIVATSLMARSVHHIVLVFMQLAVSAGWSLLVFLLTDRDLAAFSSLQASGSVLYLALFSTCLCYFLQTMAQRWVASAKVGILLSTEALLGSVLSVLLGYDDFTMRLLVGGLLVFCSVLLPEWEEWARRRRAQGAPPAGDGLPG